MKELYIDAICGAGFPSYDFAGEAVKAGKARFTGNQHNERWEWDRTALNKGTEQELRTLYSKIKDYYAGK